MIYQAALAALLTINLAGDGDSPIEPITSDVVTITISTSDDAAQVCRTYPDIVQAIAFSAGDFDVATEIVDGWAIYIFERGYNVTGSARMTVEAQTVFLDWLHSC
jgi:hypothetical protein